MHPQKHDPDFIRKCLEEEIPSLCAKEKYKEAAEKYKAVLANLKLHTGFPNEHSNMDDSKAKEEEADKLMKEVKEDPAEDYQKACQLYDGAIIALVGKEWSTCLCLKSYCCTFCAGLVCLPCTLMCGCAGDICSDLFVEIMSPNVGYKMRPLPEAEAMERE